MRLSLLAPALLLAGACGQKGDLYLPAEPQARNRATLPQTLSPIGTPTRPSAPDLRAPVDSGTGTGTAAPVRTP